MKFKLKFKLINDLKRIYNKPISNLKISNIIIIIVLATFLVFSINTFVLGGNKDQKTRDARQAKLDAILSNNQILDCTKCHVTGQSPFIAKGTIKSSYCYNCHREDIDFLVDTNSKQVHKYHEGNTSILPGYPSEVDYSTRHKEILGDCSDCHVYQSGKPPECVRCHSGNHIEEKIGLICLNCHGNIGDLFKHDTVRLQTHNIFGNNSCRMCHSSDKIALELANGIRISITQSSNLCKQCHEGIYRDWKNGNHISSIDCVICHNPHSPKNINQTILGIAKEIVMEKNVDKPPVSEKEKESRSIVRQTYNYDNVGQ